MGADAAGHFGIKDIAGFDKDDTHYYYAWWKNDTKHLHILPSDWNSPVPVGAPINMAVFSAAASVELKVNGVSLGKKPVPHGGVVHYDQTTSGKPILFKPGKLEATSCAKPYAYKLLSSRSSSSAHTLLKVSRDLHASVVFMRRVFCVI